MAKSRDLSTALAVARMATPGKHPCGGGLYLQVQVFGAGTDKQRTAKSWLFRYLSPTRVTGPESKNPGKPARCELGLGAYPDVSLGDARDRATEARLGLRDGRDPLDYRAEIKAAVAASQAAKTTFEQSASRFIEASEPGWRNEKHAAQWTATLKQHVYPIIGQMPISQVDTAAVLKVLDPIWTKLPETASRVRGRIEAVLDDAKVRGLRTGENPARWKGHLSASLQARTKVAAVKHHAALAYHRVPTFLAELRQQTGTSAKCLELVLLTAVRTSEALGARWDEFDLDAKTWTIPADRMKACKEHCVPLSDAALTLVKGLTKAGDHLFPGARGGDTLSNMSMTMLLKDMPTKWNDPEGRRITVHGFRSTFRDWVAEQTEHPHELAEAALAHTVRDKTARAYQRGTMLDRRRRMMDEWAAFCLHPVKSNVVLLRA